MVAKIVVFASGLPKQTIFPHFSRLYTSGKISWQSVKHILFGHPPGKIPGYALGLLALNMEETCSTYFCQVFLVHTVRSGDRPPFLSRLPSAGAHGLRNHTFIDKYFNTCTNFTTKQNSEAFPWIRSW